MIYLLLFNLDKKSNQYYHSYGGGAYPDYTCLFLYRRLRGSIANRTVSNTENKKGVLLWLYQNKSTNSLNSNLYFYVSTFKMYSSSHWAGLKCTFEHLEVMGVAEIKTLSCTRVVKRIIVSWTLNQWHTKSQINYNFTLSPFVFL